MYRFYWEARLSILEINKSVKAFNQFWLNLFVLDLSFVNASSNLFCNSLFISASNNSICCSSLIACSKSASILFSSSVSSTLELSKSLTDWTLSLNACRISNLLCMTYPNNWGLIRYNQELFWNYDSIIVLFSCYLNRILSCLIWYGVPFLPVKYLILLICLSCFLHT